MKKCKIIAVANQKGGVGKSSLVYGLSGVMSAQGKKVLCVDLDGQCSLSMWCKVEDKPTILECLETRHLPIYEAFPGVDITPADKMLMMNDAISRHHFLKSLLDEQRKNYDFILLDLSPSISMLHYEAMCASDYVLMPSLPSMSALAGVDAMTEYLANVAKTTGHAPKILGVVLSRIKNANLHKLVIELSRKDYHDIVLNTSIPESIAVDEAQTVHKQIQEYQPKGKATMAYKALYEELITRL